MSRKGHYPGGSTLVGPRSPLLGRTKPKQKKPAPGKAAGRQPGPGQGEAATAPRKPSPRGGLPPEEFRQQRAAELAQEAEAHRAEAAELRRRIADLTRRADRAEQAAADAEARRRALLDPPTWRLARRTPR